MKIAANNPTTERTVKLMRPQGTVNCSRTPELTDCHGILFGHTRQECASFHQNHILEKYSTDSFKINAPMKTHDDRNSPSNDNVNLYTHNQFNSNVVYSLNKNPKLISNTMRHRVHIVDAQTHMIVTTLYLLNLLGASQTCMLEGIL